MQNNPKKAYGTIELKEQAVMFDQLPEPTICSHTMTMEELGQDFGFVLYETTLHGPFAESEIKIDGLHDRAHIYLDGVLQGIQERTGKRNDIVSVCLKEGEQATLSILVENLGRVNYGPKLRDEKGILRGVKLNHQYQFGWKMYSLPCDNADKLSFAPIESGDSERLNSPVFLKGHFAVSEKADTFVRLDGFTKGCVYINGFHLGRYWNTAGPQKTLYLPAPLLKDGENELVVLELEGYQQPKVLLTDCADLG